MGIRRIDPPQWNEGCVLMNIRMNRKMRFLLIGLLIAALVLGGLVYFDVLKLGSQVDVSPKLIQASKGLNEYDISVEFNPAAKTLNCTQKVKYINRSGKDLTHLYFHLYPNAFQYEEKPVFDKEEMERAYPNEFSPGSLNMKEIRMDGKESEFVIGGYTENILMLLLDGSLAPDEAVSIEMQYTVQLPNCLGRFGYGDHTYKAVNWYPIASVYDDNGWNLDRYYSIGDPFYSDAANYRVTVKAPSDYVIAATGDIGAKRQKGGSTIWQIDALAVRDFAWIASNDFHTASQKVGNTMVTSYYYTEESGQKALEYAAAALDFFNDSFGEYPYRHFAVVESDFFIGGMEYPNLVMLDHSLYLPEYADSLELVTAHETAHQWWYGVVGNNQVMDAWIDEGLTEYSTVLYYGNRYGTKTEAEIYNTMIAEGKYNYLQTYERTADVDETIHRPSYEFSDWVLYDLLVYGKGAMMFHGLREQMGDELFFKALREYYRQYQFRNVNKEELIGAFDRSTGRSWERYFDKWLYDEKDE
jgi:hypothetical protein